MLSPCFAKVDAVTFAKLPTSTNAVESFNRVSKEKRPDVLKVVMMHTYRLDMAANKKRDLRKGTHVYLGCLHECTSVDTLAQT